MFSRQKAEDGYSVSTGDVDLAVGDGRDGEFYRQSSGVAGCVLAGTIKLDCQIGGVVGVEDGLSSVILVGALIENPRDSVGGAVGGDGWSGGRVTKQDWGLRRWGGAVELSADGIEAEGFERIGIEDGRFGRSGDVEGVVPPGARTPRSGISAGEFLQD